jgi:DNA-binding response OmpR family regulator
MVITDMRMESDAAGVEVIKAARTAPYHPAVALLTAFPVAEEDWQEMGADKMLVKPMHVQTLLQQIEKLLATHERKLSKVGTGSGAEKTATKPVKKTPVAKKIAGKASAKKTAAVKKA